MAKIYTAPGVYVEEIPELPPSIASVETAIPAFIGYTEKAVKLIANDLKLKPTRISSMQEYIEYFGEPQKEEAIEVVISETLIKGIITEIQSAASLSESRRSKHIMYYALQMFFANGGGTCLIVSVGSYIRKFAKPPSKTALMAGLNQLKKFDEPTLIIFPEAQNLLISSFKTIHDAALLQCKLLGDRFVIMDVHGDSISLSDKDSDLLIAVDNFRTKGIGADNLKFGAAYAPNIETTINYAFDESKCIVIKVHNNIPETTIKLVDLKSSDPGNYKIAIDAINVLHCVMPPSGAIVGIYASVDRNRGVWKAPANESINNCIGPAIQITGEDSASMNVDASSGKSVNAIRAFSGKGTMVWGARTLAGNDNEWRYVNVRRVFNFVEESVKKGTQQFVFEPNTADTWIRVQAMIENFLTNLWKQGALQGMKPEHAFFVSVGLGKTMTANDIIEGRMIIEIGLAVIRPAEFSILRLTYKMA